MKPINFWAFLTAGPTEPLSLSLPVFNYCYVFHFFVVSMDWNNKIQSECIAWLSFTEGLTGLQAENLTLRLILLYRIIFVLCTITNFSQLRMFCEYYFVWLQLFQHRILVILIVFFRFFLIGVLFRSLCDMLSSMT